MKTVNRYLAGLLLLVAVPALAEDPPPPPDYSRDGIRRALTIQASDLPPMPEKRGHFHFGYFEFRALGMDWRFVYLPIAAPLPGSGPQGARTMPTAQDLLRRHTTTEFPPMLDDERSFAEAREYRRVRKLTAKTKIPE